MPKRGQTREHLPTDLRAVVAENVVELMAGRTDKFMAKDSGVSYKAFERVKKRENTSLDTLQAIAKALDVPPYLLLMKGAAQNYLHKVFSTPVPDARLGSGWTRPDIRKPLLSSDKNEKNSIPQKKIKTRG